MTELPFSIEIEVSKPTPGRRKVLCTAVLRRLGNKRTVFEGTDQGNPVIVKLFKSPLKGGYHVMREWRGLRKLHSRRLNAPQPLCCGSSSHGWVMLTEKIPAAATARQLWDTAETIQQKTQLLCLLAGELARFHDRGVLQKDLHLGNFLVNRTKVFALDAAQMHFASGPVARKRSITQLASLASILPPDNTPALDEICTRYAAARRWHWTQADRRLFEKRFAHAKKRGIRRGLKKLLRTSTRHRKIVRRGFRAIAQRRFADELEFEQFVADVDALMEQGQVLKRGNTSFVSRITLAGRDLVVKRYNHKGLWHSLRHTIKGSRARRCWLHAHRLTMLGVKTPAPVAFIECLHGPLVWQSYFITEYVEGRTLHDFLRDDRNSEEQKRHALENLRREIDRLAQHRITHGDLKHTNILVTTTGLYLTDLDGMRATLVPAQRRIR